MKVRNRGVGWGNKKWTQRGVGWGNFWQGIGIGIYKVEDDTLLNIFLKDIDIFFRDIIQHQYYIIVKVVKIQDYIITNL